jgi:hypothetical protein
MLGHGADSRGTTDRQDTTGADVERLIEFVPMASPSTYDARWKGILSQTKPLRYAVSGRGSTVPTCPAPVRSTAESGRQRAQPARPPGPEADIPTRQNDVRSTPNTRHGRESPDVRYAPLADIATKDAAAKAHAREAAIMRSSRTVEKDD